MNKNVLIAYILLSSAFVILILMFVLYRQTSRIYKRQKILDEYFKKYHDMKFMMVLDPVYYYDDDFVVEFYTKCCSLYKSKFTGKEIENGIQAERKERDVSVILMFLKKCSINKMITNLRFYSKEFGELYLKALDDFKNTEEFKRGILKEVKIDG